MDQAGWLTRDEVKLNINYDYIFCNRNVFDTIFSDDEIVKCILCESNEILNISLVKLMKVSKKQTNNN